MRMGSFQAFPNSRIAAITKDWRDVQQFQCTSPQCSAKLTIRIESPRLKNDWVELLTDRSLIKVRAEKEIAINPERFEGHAIPLTSEVLMNLRKYIINALQGEKRKIVGNNKKWLLCLGEPCAELLEYLGFTREDEDWWPPAVDPTAASLFSTPLAIRLDDVEKELVALLLKGPDDEKRAAKLPYPPSPAIQTLERLLGSFDYKHSLSSRTADSKADEHPLVLPVTIDPAQSNQQLTTYSFYPSLGAVVDFHEDLIKYAYERQLASDPEKTPYYLECLQGIAEGRDSEDLRILAAIEASSGKVSYKDIREAYKDLSLHDQSSDLDDTTIIGTFKSRIADSPKQEAQLRRALQIIGQSRSSDKILSVAARSVTNYEQALSYLNATDDMDDAFLLSMYHVQVNEKPSEETTARHAMSLIAEHRGSNALKQWLETGALGEYEMDIGQAYNRLGISDRTIDDDTILATYNFHLDEAPSQLADLRSALKAIAKARKSQPLNNVVNSSMDSSNYSPFEWPVGLENIGNTCYLNSLLQFYFTIKPLRDLVLNFDQYKMAIDVKTLEKKKVGSRNVSRHEVQRAQKFVFELQRLFDSMITSPGDKVTPEVELARLTLLSSPNEADFRRRSTISGHRPSLGEISGRPVQGPLPAPIPEATSEEVGMAAEPMPGLMNGTHNEGDEDRSSEDTLVGNEALGDTKDLVMVDINGTDLQEQQQGILDDKENLPPTKVFEQYVTPEAALVPLGDSSPSRTNEQNCYEEPHQGFHKTLDEKSENVRNAVVFSPPDRPPPIPPRPETEDKRTAIQEVEYGAQQDVTEVIANVLFQLQCAIKAEFVDESGEQIDEIKKLFYGKQKSYLSNREGTLRAQEQFISNIVIDVASGPRDIYDALDGAYDVQEVELEGGKAPQYTTISQIPPILQILVQRVQYDQEKGSSFKSVNHLDFKETIYMDRYMDFLEDDLIQRRRESWEWKKELKRLEFRKAELTTTELGVETSELLAATRDCLDHLATASDENVFRISTNLSKGLEAAALHVKQELTSIDERIKHLNANISTQFNDRRSMPYRLHSVFIHRGAVNSGHYWIYIRDFVDKIWRKYNDGYVTIVTDDSEIFGQEPDNRPATPYFLVYVKDELKEDLVNSVCRRISKQAETNDPGMENAPDNATDGSVLADSSTYDGLLGGHNSTTQSWYKQNHNQPAHGW
ncbi:MAG: hypothetical protein Q9214_000187 [Letrouitia sp. 1 TL-2023]